MGYFCNSIWLLYSSVHKNQSCYIVLEPFTNIFINTIFLFIEWNGTVSEPYSLSHFCFKVRNLITLSTQNNPMYIKLEALGSACHPSPWCSVPFGSDIMILDRFCDLYSCESVEMLLFWMRCLKEANFLNLNACGQSKLIWEVEKKKWWVRG